MLSIDSYTLSIEHPYLNLLLMVSRFSSHKVYKLSHLTATSKMPFPKEINIYVEGTDDPVFELSKIELAKSDLLRKLVSSLNLCDGCSQPLSIIIAREEKQTVVWTFGQLSAQETGLDNFKG